MEEAATPLFKHSRLMEPTDANLHKRMAQIINIAMTECERAYPIFHAVFKQKISPRRALLPLTLM